MPVPQEFLDIIKFVQDAIQPLKDADEIVCEEDLKQFKNRNDHINNPAEYLKNASRILDFLFLKVPAIVLKIINDNEGKDPETIGAAVAYHFWWNINSAFYYLDEKHCVPHLPVESNRLYEKVVLLEWLFKKIEFFVDNDKNFTQSAKAFIKFMLNGGDRSKLTWKQSAALKDRRRIPELKVRLDEYAEKYKVQRLTLQQVEEKYSAKQKEKKEEPNRAPVAAPVAVISAQAVQQQPLQLDVFTPAAVRAEQQGEQKLEVINDKQLKAKEDSLDQAIEFFARCKENNIDVSDFDFEVVFSKGPEIENFINQRINQLEEKAKAGAANYADEIANLRERLNQNKQKQAQLESIVMELINNPPANHIPAEVKQDEPVSLEERKLASRKNEVGSVIEQYKQLPKKSAEDLRRAKELQADLDKSKTVEEFDDVLSNFLYKGKSRSEQPRNFMFTKASLRFMLFQKFCPFYSTGPSVYSPLMFTSVSNIKRELRFTSDQVAPDSTPKPAAAAQR